MALMFPSSFPRSDSPGASGEAAVYDALRRVLGRRWRVFYDCTIRAGGEEGRIDFILLHPERGILLLAVAPAEVEIDALAAESAVATMLREQGFLDRFVRLPRIAAVAVPPDRCDDLAERIDAALPLMAAATSGRRGWADWVAQCPGVPGDRDVPPTPFSPTPSAAVSTSGVRHYAAGYLRRRGLAHAGVAMMSAIFIAVPVDVPWSFAAMFRGAEPPPALSGDSETPSQALDAALPPASALVEIEAPPAVTPTAKPPVPAIAESRRKVASHPQHRVHKTRHQESRFPWWDRFQVSP